MKRTAVIILAMCAGLLWLGEAHAARFETHATNAAVPEGTVYDTTTNLLWEMKTERVDGPSNPSDVRDANNTYTWSSGEAGAPDGEVPDGTAFTVFLGILNDARSSDGVDITGCFANHCDWRLPQIYELKGIVEGSRSNPSIDPIFGPTKSGVYWTATTYVDYPAIAWGVNFNGGARLILDKPSGYYVRAVRSGL